MKAYRAWPRNVGTGFLLALLALPRFGVCSDAGSVDPASFFPTTLLHGHFGEVLAKRTARIHQAMGEPSLAGQKLEPRDQCRFLFLPSFHRPLVVRFWKTADGAAFRAVHLGGRGGNDPLGPIEDETKGTIPETQWKQIEAGFAEEAVRQPLKSLTEDQINLLSGMDGAEWILEERRGDKYRVTAVWSPPAWEEMRKKGFDPKEFAKFGLPVPPSDFRLPDLRPFIRQCQLLLDLAKVHEPKLY